jgi:RES domain-containing protein
MSATKRRLEEIEARGFNDTGAYACATCLDDPALGDVIGAALEDEECSYCEAPRSASLDVVLAHMLQALRLEYLPWSEENPGWDNEDGVYTAHDYWVVDLVFDHLDGEWDPRIWDDVARALADADPWFDRNAYAIRDHEQLVLSWRRFAHVVKARKRRILRPRSAASDDPDEWIGTNLTVDFIGGALADLPAVVRTIPAGTALWRARYRAWDSVADLGPVPGHTKKKPGRMTPPGLNWFYGASDLETAVLETVDAKRLEPMSVAAFRAVRGIPVLDLTGEGLRLPSIYDLDLQAGRATVLFLRSFAAEISQPVEDDPAIDYLPTQVVTRYISQELPDLLARPVEGIMYPSSAGRGVNVVLFHGSGACLDPGQPEQPESRLRLDLTTLRLLTVREVDTQPTEGLVGGLPRSRKPASWSLW